VVGNCTNFYLILPLHKSKHCFKKSKYLATKDVKFASKTAPFDQIDLFLQQRMNPKMLILHILFDSLTIQNQKLKKFDTLTAKTIYFAHFYNF
jgi:hypothetical protein